MNRKEYKEALAYELKLASYQGGLVRKLKSFLKNYRIRHITPNTNCMYMCRKMWYLYENGKQFRAKRIYLKLIHKYGCVIFPTAHVKKGFHITHPTGIVIGNCDIGEDFMIYQNCTIGSKVAGQGSPVIGNRVELCSNSIILGGIKVADDVVIGAQSLVIKDVLESGVYAGSPCKKIK